MNHLTTTPQTNSRSILSFTSVAARSLLSTMLLLAVVTKMSSTNIGLFDVFLSTFETAVAYFLFTGRFQIASTIAAIIFFCGSICWSLITIATKAPSCGCFGAHHVDTLHVFMFSAAGEMTLLLLLVTRTRFWPQYYQSFQLGLLISTGLLAAASGLVTLDIVYGAQKTPRPDDAQYQSWIGNPIPVKGRNGIEKELGVGQWTVVFLRSGCSNCDSVANEWKQSAINSRHLLSARKLAFLYLNYPAQSGPHVVGPWAVDYVIGDEFANLAAPSTVWLTDSVVERIETP